MTPLATFAVLAGLVAFATVLGLVWRSRDGQVRRASHGGTVRRDDVAADLGSGATLLQFSSELCAPCTATRAVLTSIADELPAVTHIDVDVTASAALVSRYGILQTPTTLILDGNGTVRARIGGAARRDTVRIELDRILAAA